MGMAKRHRANPLAALRKELIFATPILFSGMASLLLLKSETDILSQHVKETTLKLLKLHKNTPSPVVFFLAGRLPGEASEAADTLLNDLSTKGKHPERYSC